MSESDRVDGARRRDDWWSARGDEIHLLLDDFDDLYEVEVLSHGAGRREVLLPQDRDSHVRLWWLFEALVRRHVPPELQGKVWKVKLRLPRELSLRELVTGDALGAAADAELDLGNKSTFDDEP